MNIYISNIPAQYDVRKLEKELKRPMAQLGIHAYSVAHLAKPKQSRASAQNFSIPAIRSLVAQLDISFGDLGLDPRRKGQRLPQREAVTSHQRPQHTTKYAFVTLPTLKAAELFLKVFGGRSPRLPLTLGTLTASVNKPDRQSKIDAHLLRSLQEGQKAEEERLERSRAQEADAAKGIRSFPISAIACGTWGTETSEDSNGHDVTAFIPRCESRAASAVTFKQRGILIKLCSTEAGNTPENDRTIILSIPYHLINAIVTASEQYVMFDVSGAPRIYELINYPENQDSGFFRQEYRRILGWNVEHELYAGLSFAYCVCLKNTADHQRVLSLSQRGGIPEIRSKALTVMDPRKPFVDAFRAVIIRLQNQNLYPFPVAYQLSALISNGLMPPEQVKLLLQPVQKLVKSMGVYHCTNLLSTFRTAHAGYEINALFNPASGQDEFIMELFERCIADYRETRAEQEELYQKKRLQDMVLVNSVQVTPTGVLAIGPQWERSNRVLRKYDAYSDYFLRVQFSEEDLEPFQAEVGVDAEPVYAHFKQRLVDGITIAGRKFEFLGFSGSGLKASTCWFVAQWRMPDGSIMGRNRIIEELGDFARIKVPGRWAARIGQAFSDTIRSIDVDPAWEHDIPDIEGTDAKGTKRCFSDGVGTLSQGLLDKIYEQSEAIAATRATVFQIRYGGAKGMVTLNPLLRGTQLCLRPSMKKFEGSNDRNLEICTWGKPLPMFLNRPLVMMLEGLGVPASSFLAAQRLAVKRLRDSSCNSFLAAQLLKRQNISAASLKLHWMVQVLKNISEDGIDFWDDDFLQRGYELVLCMMLRGIKYRARIPIDHGITLIGVLDETGFLREGQIFAQYTNADGQDTVVKGRVLITRSPVHHPGDVQMADAVDVPPTSPLCRLRNCVVFSIHGDRPLAGMLSGGDLDGDLYNIIRDPSFFIPKSKEPAEYPPARPKELPHAVTFPDVAEFFVSFMKSNLLGLISIRHLIIADQSPSGIFDPDCLLLAELASVAVDFPKTGHGVERAKIPPARKSRPHWMAPSPRARILDGQLAVEAERKPTSPLETDEVESTGHWYYKSGRVLGQLYDDIDESRFLKEISDNLRAESNSHRRNTALPRIWEYMLPWTPNCRPYLDEARRLKAEWEACLFDIRSQASETPWRGNCVEETEVFFGVLLGRGASTRRERERAERMKEEFEDLATWIVAKLKAGDRDVCLGRSMAALRLCLEQEMAARGRDKKEGGRPKGEGKSFAWVAVSVLLTEVDAMQKESKRAGLGHPARRGGRR